MEILNEDNIIYDAINAPNETNSQNSIIINTTNSTQSRPIRSTVCSKCLQVGHNRRSCQNEEVIITRNRTAKTIARACGRPNISSPQIEVPEEQMPIDDDEMNNNIVEDIDNNGDHIEEVADSRNTTINGLHWKEYAPSNDGLQTINGFVSEQTTPTFNPVKSLGPKKRKAWLVDRSRLIGYHFPVTIQNIGIQKRSPVIHSERGKCMICKSFVTIQCDTCMVYLCTKPRLGGDNCFKKFHTLSNFT